MTSNPDPTPSEPNRPFWKQVGKWVNEHPVVQICGAIVILVALGGYIADLGKLLPWTIAQKGGAEQAGYEPADKRAPIVTTLSDGMVVAISPSYESRFKKEDVLLAHKEMNTPENAEMLARASAKRHILRTIGGLTLKDILLLRTSIEDTVLKSMQDDMGPKGLTILSFSLGEISRK